MNARSFTSSLPIGRKYFGGFSGPVWKSFFLFLIWSTAFTASFVTRAQTGYIYVHSKTLNETASGDITYSVSGGPTAVSNFTLNDQPTRTTIRDIGFSQNGRIWAVTNDQKVWYREIGSATWVQTTLISSNQRIDGGAGTSAYFINGGIAFYTADGTSSTAISAGTSFTDIGSGWDNRPYAINATQVLRYSGAGTTWNVINSSLSPAHVDVDPVSGNVAVATTSGATPFYSVTPAGVATSLGAPTNWNTAVAPRDIAVTGKGEIFVTGFISSAAGGYYVSKKLPVGWSSYEASSYDVAQITGGPGGQILVTMNSGGWNNFSYPYLNIFARAEDGANVYYIDDERIRTAPTGNSIKIPVAPGTYTITETVPGGWNLEKVSVFDPSSNSSSNVPAKTATVNVAADEVVHVVFQTGAVVPFDMTNSCTPTFTETFGTGATGTFGAAPNGTTTYHLINTSTPAEDGFYKIVNRGSDFNTWPTAAAIVDHTSGDGQGYMYAVNAGYDKGEFFRRRFTNVKPGGNYTFSAWIVDLTPQASVNVNVNFSVYDANTQALLGTYTTGELPGITAPAPWQQFGFTFTAASTDIDLVISNVGFGGNGNDLALDDISFLLEQIAAPTLTVTTNCGSGATITVTSPVGSGVEYSLDGVNFQSSPVFANLPAGNYTVTDRFVNTTCTNSSVQNISVFSICGNVYNDIDALTDNVVDNNGGAQPSSTLPTLYASLVSGGVVIATVPVVNGTYSFGNVSAGTYSVVLKQDSTNSTTPSLPAGWINTGEHLGSFMGSDGTVNGILPIGTVSSGVVNANLGIQQPPTALTSTLPPQPNPGGSNHYTVPPASFDGDDQNGGTVTSITITAFPTNTESITINGNTYTPGTFPPTGVTVPTDANGNPTQPIAVNPIDGNTSVVITYTATDNGGAVSPPATVTIPFTAGALPVRLASFKAAGSGGTVVLDWVTLSEANSKGFFVERSTDTHSWESLGWIVSQAENGMATIRLAYRYVDYQPATPVSYYRLKMMDLDGTYIYSSVQSVEAADLIRLVAAPNPARDFFRISGVPLTDIREVTLQDLTGRSVYTGSFPEQGFMNVKNVAKGLYVLSVQLNNGIVRQVKVLVQ